MRLRMENARSSERLPAPQGHLSMIPQTVLGFTNRWYRAGIENATIHDLGEGNQSRMFDFPFFIAAKLEAFKGRENGDYYGSKDMEERSRRRFVWTLFCFGWIGRGSGPHRLFVSFSRRHEPADPKPFLLVHDLREAARSPERVHEVRKKRPPSLHSLPPSLPDHQPWRRALLRDGLWLQRRRVNRPRGDELLSESISRPCPTHLLDALSRAFRGKLAHSKITCNCGHSPVASAALRKASIAD